MSGAVTSKRIQITDAKTIAKRLDAAGVAVFAFHEDGRVQSASYGADKQKCTAMGAWIDWIMQDMTSEKLPAPVIRKDGR